MFILKNLTQLEKAVTKARTVKPIVRIISFGVYAVQGSKGNFYTVECKRNEQGEKVVICECKGAERGLVCFHSCSALELHCTIAKHRATARA
jgi:hypothetical protein